METLVTAIAAKMWVLLWYEAYLWFLFIDQINSIVTLSTFTMILTLYLQIVRHYLLIITSSIAWPLICRILARLLLLLTSDLYILFYWRIKSSTVNKTIIYLVKFSKFPLFLRIFPPAAEVKSGPRGSEEQWQWPVDQDTVSTWQLTIDTRAGNEGRWSKQRLLIMEKADDLGIPAQLS